MMWLILIIHLSILFALFTHFFFVNKHEFHLSKNAKIKLILLFIVSIFVNFLFLKTYPYVAVGDEIRDGAFDAMQIASGEVDNIFGYGRYNSHGLIIPTLNSFFYNIFKNSVYSYRIPTAIIGVLDVVLLYLLLNSFTNSTIAFWSSFLLACHPLHIFYSRTETVVIFSSLITTLLIYFSYRTIRYPKEYFYLAFLIGFSFNFHASVKIIGLILIPILFIKLISFKNIFTILKKILLSILMIIIGFGPRILYTNIDIFLNLSRLDSSYLGLPTLFSRYIDSLKVIAFNSTTSHYFDHQPLLSLPFFILFILGIIYLYKINRSFFFLMMYLLLLIPFTNSAVTDFINGDHRLMPLLPVLFPFVASTISFLSKSVPKILSLIFQFLIGIYIIQVCFYSFYFQKININDYGDWRGAKDYLSMHLIYLMKKEKFPGEITVYLSNYNAQNFNCLHYKEQYNFFFPDKIINFLPWDYLDDHTAALSTNMSKNLEINCLDKKNKFLCPLGDSRNFEIYY